MRTAGVVVSCTGRCFAVLFFYCLDVLVDEGVLAIHTLFAFFSRLAQLVMGWGNKALDGWMDGSD
jgi:hypothetical protein